MPAMLLHIKQQQQQQKKHTECCISFEDLLQCITSHQVKLLSVPPHKFLCPYAVISHWIKLECTELVNPQKAQSS
jgi:hypothetical protein